MAYAFSNLELQEGKDFKRVVSFSKDGEYIDILPEKLLLLTAISKPKRLLSFLPNNTKMEAFEDHHIFTKEELDNIKLSYKGYTIITTSKDIVKLQAFNLENLYLMDLTLMIENSVNLNSIYNYIDAYSNNKK
jgi:tetraacyldisaccharide 4'-kinase